MTRNHEDRVKEYRSIHELKVEPYRRGQETSASQAVNFATLLVQGFMLLHGGALVAFPSLFKALEIDLTTHPQSLIWLGALLVAGLIFASIAGFSGFFALANGADGHMKMIESASYDAYAEAFNSPEYEPHIQEQKSKEAEARADRYYKRYSFWRVSGIVCIFLSLAAFIAAAGIGFFAVLAITANGT